MTIKHIIEGNAKRNTEIEVECFLVAANSKVYLLDDDSEPLKLDSSLNISDSWVWEQLEKYVPPYGGGQWAFFEDCKVTLVIISDGKNEYVKVLSVDVDRKDLVYHLDPNLKVEDYSSNFELINVMIDKDDECQIEKLTGYFLFSEDGSASLNSMANEKERGNISLPILIAELDDIVSINFYSDHYPEYRALVTITANVTKVGNEGYVIKEISNWKVFYSGVCIEFDGDISWKDELSAELSALSVGG